jgi:hypothetical protein
MFAKNKTECIVHKICLTGMKSNYLKFLYILSAHIAKLNGMRRIKEGQ